MTGSRRRKVDRIDVVQLTASEYAARLRSEFSSEELSVVHGCPVVVVTGPVASDDVPSGPGSRPCVIIAVDRASGTPEWADIHLDVNDSRLTAALSTVARAPIAAASLAVLLRGSGQRPIDDGLAAESSVYSLLQAGPEFTAWRESTAAGLPPTAVEPAVIIDRESDLLTIALNRPQRHNAIDVALRDGLCEALQLALVDPTIERVVLRGDGPSFCSGGDLATFGSFGNPASAHVVRLTRSPARLMARLADRLGHRFEVRIHGAAMGGGIELAAFAARIVAHPDTRIALPETPLGLIPGAGGTVSLPARIGRHRTLLLALCGTSIDAATALGWGLIDAIDDSIGPHAAQL